MTKPFSISAQDLTIEQQKSNETILSLLFDNSAYNQAGVANFDSLCTIRLRRDDHCDEAFTQAINTIIQHIDSSILPTDVAVPAEKSILIRDLLGVLAERRILLGGSGLFAITRDAQENRKRAHEFFQDCLTIHYFKKEAAHLQSIIDTDKQLETPLLLKHDELQKYLNDSIKRKIDSREENIKQCLTSIELREKLTRIQTLPDGDCFYHATMLNIIYQILANQIEEDSQTAKVLQSTLLPAINQELQAKGAPTLDFSGLNLKQAILLCLRMVSLDRLTNINPERLFIPVNENNDLLVSSLQSCDFYHLLKEICAPVLRKIMLTQLNKHEEEIKTLLENTCVSYWVFHFAKELGFTNKDKIMSAQQTWNNAELADAEAALETAVKRRWNLTIQKIKQQAAFKALSTEEDKIKFLHAQYKEYWTQNKAVEVKDYCAIHAHQGVMAGPVQQSALMNALHVNMNLVHTTTSLQTPLLPKKQDAGATFLYEYQHAHFNAYAQKEGSPSLADALHHMMHLALQSRADFKKSTYQWKPASMYMFFDKYKRKGMDVSDRVWRKTEISIKKTQALLCDMPEAKDMSDDALSPEQAILKAAKMGYDGFFKSIKQNESISEEEEKSIALAIELQNEEIDSYMKNNRPC